MLTSNDAKQRLRERAQRLREIALAHDATAVRERLLVLVDDFERSIDEFAEALGNDAGAKPGS